MDSQIYLESIEPMDGLSNLKSIPTTRWSQARFPAFSETSVRQTRDACGIQTLNYKDHNYKTKKFLLIQIARVLFWLLASRMIIRGIRSRIRWKNCLVNQASFIKASLVWIQLGSYNSDS